MPAGEAGLYYFSIFYLVDEGENTIMEIRLNNVALCTAKGDHYDNGAEDPAHSTCSVVADLLEGKCLHNSYKFCTRSIRPVGDSLAKELLTKEL